MSSTWALVFAGQQTEQLQRGITNEKSAVRSIFWALSNFQNVLGGNLVSRGRVDGAGTLPLSFSFSSRPRGCWRQLPRHCSQTWQRGRGTAGLARKRWRLQSGSSLQSTRLWHPQQRLRSPPAICPELLPFYQPTRQHVCHKKQSHKQGH